MMGSTLVAKRDMLAPPRRNRRSPLDQLKVGIVTLSIPFGLQLVNYLLVGGFIPQKKWCLIQINLTILRNIY